ncbi:glycosyl hydrolase 53 family protein [Demequina sp. NBRC 110053]|uniref:glycosyl hydrolase 53 family protein n=1 Tax=Demequina sp. NBRC 110053 TaxID=1570342 RepID=UPI0009FDBE71|nr:glycosyl hydrolase 53 family protein [Demequina sp. NBRC 110053]
MRMRSALGAVTAVSATAVVGVGLVAPAAAADPVEAGITVPVVEDLAEDFMNGVDASSILSLEESGVTFKDFDGNEADVFDVMAEAGVNYSRIRVWNDPFDADGNGYGGGTVDAERATEIGLRSTSAGMRVFVDFHYADFWAHPGQQPLPKAWEGLTLAERADAMYDYTVETLSMMDDAGVDVGMVQIGNENSGLLLSETEWPDSGVLFDAASRGVRDALGEDVKIAIHFTNPERGDYGWLAEQLATFDTDPVADGVQPIDYDVFASSYYAYWHGTLENLTAQLSQVADTYGKDVIVAETSWAYTLEDGDGYPNNIRTAYDQYSTSVQGQALAVRDVIDAVANVGEAGLGVFYWEPAWLPVGPPEELAANELLWEEFGSGWASSHAGDYSADAAANHGGSGWDNQAMFDHDGDPLESLRVWDYVRYGTVGPRDIDSVASPTITVVEGDTWSLPSTVAVSYTDGTTEQQSVTWNAQPSWITGAGTYEVTGTTSAGLEVEAVVTVVDSTSSGQNWVVNPGFEDGAAPWTGTGSGFTISAPDDPFEGSSSTHFYSGMDFSFSISQVITGVPAGDYRLSAQAQGRAAVAGESTSITLASGISSASAPFSLSGYEGWHSPRTPVVSVAAGQTVTVSATFDLTAGAWGTIDQFQLVEVTPVVEADTSALETVHAEGEAVSRDGWTAVSLLAFDRAMARASFILAASAPSQAAVDAAEDVLAAAIEGLEEGEGTVPDPTVESVVVTVTEGEEIALPETVTVVAYDESETTETVTWNDVLDLITSPGVYTVSGVTENGWTATATITVTERNWILNGGFENGVDDVSPWTIEATEWPAAEVGTAWVAAYGDIEGSFALSGWSSATGGPSFGLEASQTTAELPAGTYRLTATSAGGNDVSGGASDTTYEVGAWDGAASHTVELSLPGWPDQDTGSVDFTLTEAAAVDVWIYADIVTGDWSYVDDVSLFRIADPDASVDTSPLESAIADAGAIDRAAYTAESLAALDLAVERGEIVLAQSRPEQATVDAATAAIVDAIDSLAAVPEEPVDPVEPGEPDEPGDPGDGGDGSGDGGDGGAEPRITVSDSTLVPGQSVTVTVAPVGGDTVELGIESEYQQLAVAPVVNASATATVTIPTTLEPGVHHLLALDEDGDVIASLEVTVVSASAGEMAQTGAPDVALPLAIALALVALGGAMAFASRRREVTD